MKTIGTFLGIVMLVVVAAMVVAQFGLRIPTTTQLQLAALATRHDETTELAFQAQAADLPADVRSRVKEEYREARKKTNEFVELFTLQVEDSVFWLDAALLDGRAREAVKAHEEFAEAFDRDVRPLLDEDSGQAAYAMQGEPVEAIGNPAEIGEMIVKFWFAEQQRRRKALREYVTKLRMTSW